MTRVHGLFVLKSLCALFVVINHVPLYGRGYMDPLFCLAVPVFLLISGFFLFKNNPKQEIEKAKTWLKKIIFISILLNLFYFLFKLLATDKQFEYCDFLLTAFWGCKMSEHLWYLHATWQALLLFIILRKYAADRLLYYIPLLIIVNLACSRYAFLFSDREQLLPLYCRLNVLTTGLPYLIIGYLIAKHKLHHLSKRYQYIFLSTSVFLVVTEFYLLLKSGLNTGAHYMISTLPFAVSCFIFSYNPRYCPKIMVWIGEKHSANIYFFHPFLAWCISFILPSVIFSVRLENMLALVVYVICIPISIFLNKLLLMPLFKNIGK